MGNDPVNNVDPDGGFAGPGPGFLGKLFGYKIATAANGVLGRVPGLLSGIGKFALPVISGLGRELPNSFEKEENRQDVYRNMFNEVLKNPEISYFHSLAPNTEFDLGTNLPSWASPNTKPISGIKSVKGPAKITLSPAAFESKEMLFTILGHELIHASHFESGSYARWRAKYGKSSAHHISEYFAYKWSAPKVVNHKLEDRLAGMEKLEFHRKNLPQKYPHR